MDQWHYSELLHNATLRALLNLEQTFKGVHPEGGAPAPFRLKREQIKEVRAHVVGIIAVVNCMELEPTPAAKVREGRGNPQPSTRTRRKREVGAYPER